MKTNTWIPALAAAGLIGVSGLAQTPPPSTDEVARHCTNLPFQMAAPSVPAFPEFRVSILDHGAVPDGHTLNTKAFADAIEACARAGGGTVVVPPGAWLTGPIRLESNINLHLEAGALLQFSRRIADYPLIAGLNGKSKRFIFAPPIHAYRAKNIAITGSGVIDGGGEVWRPVKKEKLTSRQWKILTEGGGVVTPDGKVWWPSKQAMEGEAYLRDLEKTSRTLTAEDFARAGEFLRPDLVRLVECTGILLDGPTFRNSPRFHVYLVQSESIVVRRISIVCDWYAQNGDGLDLNGCRNAVIYGVTVDAGDDGICIKPGKIASTQAAGPACENIVIDDCTVYHAHGGFSVGSETYGGARNIVVRNCTYIGTDVGLRFKSARGKGGTIRDLFIDGIRMRSIQNEAILFDLSYGGDSPEVEATKRGGEDQPEPVTDLTPQFRDISIRNIVCDGAARAVLIHGLPEMAVKNIRIEDMHISSDKGIWCVDADSISITGADLRPASGPVVTVNQSTNLLLKNITYPQGAESFISVDGRTTRNIRLEGVDVSRSKKAIIYAPTASTDAVIQK